ncbi:unnamed protein product [Bubo scandiacus]
MRRQPLRREELMVSNHKQSDLQPSIKGASTLKRNSKKQHCRRALESAVQHLDRPCSPCPTSGAAGEVRICCRNTYVFTKNISVESLICISVIHYQTNVSFKNITYHITQSLLCFSSCQRYLRLEFCIDFFRTDDRLEAKHTFRCFGTVETISPAQQRIKSQLQSLQPSHCFIANFCTYVCDQLQDSDIWQPEKSNPTNFSCSPQVINLHGTNYHRQLSSVALMDWGDNKAILP